jgi:hypothetical protein
MRYKCENCGANRGLAKYKTGEWCFSCNKFLPIKNLELNTSNLLEELKYNPTDLNLIELPLKAFLWLQKYYISNCKLEDIKWSNSYNRICFSFGNNLTSHYLRSIIETDRNKWLLLEKEEKNIFNIQKHGFNELVIVEDPISAIRVSDFVDVVALGGTNFNSPLLVTLFLNYKKLTIWLDGDRAGQTASDKFRKHFKLLKPIKLIKTKKDPKNHTPTEMEEILNDRIDFIKSTIH